MAVEHGIEFGWMRAHKHVAKPDDEAIKQAVADAVMTEICEWFEFSGDTVEAKE